MGNVPLSLYIHFPWCAKKCPYCDFNSHTLRGAIPEKAYIDCLIDEMHRLSDSIDNREIISIFMGGGTPSLFSAYSIQTLLQTLQSMVRFHPNIEITLEANPGTIEQGHFKGYFDAGVNRISLGVQSFHNDYLKKLGRIHDATEALNAIDQVQYAGFDNFNIDLMYGLPLQTPEDALKDLDIAFKLAPPHISWYQLTIEPQTFFYKQPPVLPKDNHMAAIEEQGLALFKAYGYHRYEISAYTKNQPCRHNHNYWQFGDYIGIGAGAHGKITCQQSQKIYRYHNIKNPKQYMDSQTPYQQEKVAIQLEEIPFEYMLNALRLTGGTTIQNFQEKTHMDVLAISPILNKAVENKLLHPLNGHIQATPLGLNFLNDLTQMFLPVASKDLR